MYRAVLDEDRMIINLASKEYGKIIEKYLEPGDRIAAVVFGEPVDGKVKQKGTCAKIARGGMVRYMAESQIMDLESIRDFIPAGITYQDISIPRNIRTHRGGFLK